MRIGAGALSIKARIVTAEQPWTDGPSISFSSGRLEHRSEVGVRSIIRLEVPAHIAAGATSTDRGLALVHRVSDVVLGAPRHLPRDGQRPAPHRALLIRVRPPARAGIERW